MAVPVDHRVEIKENKNSYRYLDLTRELKKLRERVTVIPFVIGALGTIPKVFERGLKESEIGRRAEDIQATAIVRSVRILRRVLET